MTVALSTGVGLTDFARTLLEAGEVLPGRGALKRARTKSTSPRIAWLAAAIKNASVAWLVRHGGWRARAVVTQGRRREGRVWASGIVEGLELAFGPASIELLARVYEAQRGDEHATIPALPDDLHPAGVGDLIFFHLVADALASDRPVPAADPATLRAMVGKRKQQQAAARADERALLRAALIARSPLTALFRADELATPATPALLLGQTAALTALIEKERARAAQLFSPLVRGDRAALLVYLDDALARRWVQAEHARRKAPIEQAAQRFTSFEAALAGLVDAALAAKRPDALAPVGRFFQAYLVAFGTRERVIADLQERAYAQAVHVLDPALGPPATLRERLLATEARVFAVSCLLAEAAERVLETPYVDRTEEEKLFLAYHHDVVKPARPELESIRRALAGEIG